MPISEQTTTKNPKQVFWKKGRLVAWQTPSIVVLQAAWKRKKHQCGENGRDQKKYSNVRAEKVARAKN